LGREFYDKAQKIKALLQKASQTTPTPIKETPTTPTPIKETSTTPTPIKETPTTPTPIKETSITPKEEPLEATLKSDPIPKFTKVEQAFEEDEKIKEIPRKPIMNPPPPPPRAMEIDKTPQSRAQPIPKEEETTPIKKPTLPPKFTPSKVRVPPGIPEMNPESVANEEEQIIQPIIDLSASGLNLNPDDFMIKQRPKTITVVPKDAKNKLKTSPFAQVENPLKNWTPKIVPPTTLVKPKLKTSPPISAPPELSSEEFTPIAYPKQVQPSPKIPVKNTDPQTSVDPAQLVTPKSKVIAPPKSPPSEQKTAEINEPDERSLEEAKMTIQQKSTIEKSLMDLKIKKANISKISLDFDMKELTGEITSDELEEKKEKLILIKQQLDAQIKELEDMMK
ncbi:MAG: hypothetical protein MUP85_11255, partial [Candidatus Lokiarchaeota archaeon]|nr:hypothetical protein [Candidatus Lokiarchaeota archaeon]